MTTEQKEEKKNDDELAAVDGVIVRPPRVPVDRYQGRLASNALNMPVLEAREEEIRRMQDAKAIAMGGAINLPNVPVPAHLPVRRVVPRGPRNNNNINLNGEVNEAIAARQNRVQHPNHLYTYGLFSKEEHFR